MKYRIVEEKGQKTGKLRFYIQKRKKKHFGGYKWVNAETYDIETKDYETN
jgi:hypothetical protein